MCGHAASFSWRSTLRTLDDQSTAQRAGFVSTCNQHVLGKVTVLCTPAARTLKVTRAVRDIAILLLQDRDIQQTLVANEHRGDGFAWGALLHFQRNI